MRYLDLTTADAFNAAMTMGILADLLAIAVLVLVVVLLRRLAGLRTTAIEYHDGDTRCAACGHAVEASSDYCPGCGRRVER